MSFLISLGWSALGLAIMFAVLSVVVLSMVWLERKALGRLQLRYGPTRTGLFGLMQPVADAVKLIIKEDIIPDDSEKAIFWIAPVIVVVSAFVIWVTIPGGDNVVIRNLPLGLFYIIAFAVIGILGLVLAGWGSANKYGIMGGLRSAAQLISYEIPVVLVAASVAILAQSLDMREIVAQQSTYPYLVVLPLGFVVFFIAGLAEVGRTPFDIYHAESEVVGGPFVEYSGAHWSVFFLAEYINTFAIAALTTLLFLGGWGGPALPDVVWFLLKTYAVVLVVFWVRGTFPRPAHRPTHGLRLEGDGSAVVLYRHYRRRLPVLRPALVEPDTDVRGWSRGCRMDNLPAHDRAGPTGRGGAASAGGAPGGNRSGHLAADAGIILLRLTGEPSMVTNTRKITVEDFEAMAADPGHRYELVDGELVDMDGKPRHGVATGEIYLLLRGHIGINNLPFDVGVNTGFQMDPFTLRFPDVHVTSWERMRGYDEDAPGWPAFAPDVAIEVVSASNTPTELARKGGEYFANGTRVMWIADPRPRTVRIRRPGVEDEVFGLDDTLTGEPEIPGFSCAVADIFAVLDRAGTSTREDRVAMLESLKGMMLTLTSTVFRIAPAGDPAIPQNRRPRYDRVSWGSRRSPGTAKSASRTAPAAWFASATARRSACRPA